MYMTFEEANLAISKYKDLAIKAEELAKILYGMDKNYYELGKTISSVDFYYSKEGEIYVTVDSSSSIWGGGIDYNNMVFPLKYLFMNSEELEQAVAIEKKEREAKKAEEEAAQEAARLNKQENYERDLYQKLKEKFEK